jgi:hypothetical protein
MRIGKLFRLIDKCPLLKNCTTRAWVQADMARVAMTLRKAEGKMAPKIKRGGKEGNDRRCQDKRGLREGNWKASEREREMVSAAGK